MRVTVDTNLIVSAALWGGNPRRVIDSARDGFFELYTSPRLLNELKGILGRAKFEKQFLRVGFTPENLIDELLGFALIIDAFRCRPAFRATQTTTRFWPVLSPRNQKSSFPATTICSIWGNTEIFAS